ncbi:hypothetical protein [Pontibacter arcticus]|uniref:Uncharacterized protein n=1 Tax=Pontibacter arcticus TaxID=2080288 RepID=A0A364RI06_9BACT|nr:hypothetical protein [Pontibacter arcticus]RAU83905.1 hypothetical protein DP923_02235 [Pontibacter arcticus]
MDKNKNKNQQSELSDKSKGNKKDISNSLNRDAVGKTGSNNPTPQARTDNEQDNEKRKHTL